MHVGQPESASFRSPPARCARCVARSWRTTLVVARTLLHARILGDNKLRAAHTVLVAAAVRAAYGIKPDEDILAFLLKLNLALAAQEAKGLPITPPACPRSCPPRRLSPARIASRRKDRAAARTTRPLSACRGWRALTREGRFTGVRSEINFRLPRHCPIQPVSLTSVMKLTIGDKLLARRRLEPD